MYKLICDEDPKALGIEKDGKFDMERLKEHILSCRECREFAADLLHDIGAELEASLAGVGHMWAARYMLPDGTWQTWSLWEDWQEAKEAMEFHAQGRPYEITIDRGDRLIEGIEKLHAAIAAMEKTRAAFKSKLIAQARAEVERALEIFENLMD